MLSPHGRSKAPFLVDIPALQSAAHSPRTTPLRILFLRPYTQPTLPVHLLSSSHRIIHSTPLSIPTVPSPPFSQTGPNLPTPTGTTRVSPPNSSLRVNPLNHSSRRMSHPRSSPYTRVHPRLKCGEEESLCRGGADMRADQRMRDALGETVACGGAVDMVAHWRWCGVARRVLVARDLVMGWVVGLDLC